MHARADRLPRTPKRCTVCGGLGHNRQTCKGDPRNCAEGVIAGTAKEDACSWTRRDGRTLHMPWGVEELWARLGREVTLHEMYGAEKDGS